MPTAKASGRGSAAVAQIGICNLTPGKVVRAGEGVNAAGVPFRSRLTPRHPID